VGYGFQTRGEEGWKFDRGEQRIIKVVVIRTGLATVQKIRRECSR
jgi:hypothetical protein